MTTAPQPLVGPRLMARRIDSPGCRNSDALAIAISVSDTRMSTAPGSATISCGVRARGIEGTKMRGEANPPCVVFSRYRHRLEQRHAGQRGKRAGDRSIG